MVFSDPTNDGGIVEEARWLVGANSTSYPTKDLTRNINRWFDRVVHLILQSAGRWQWDDNNQTDHPVATTNLVSGQQDYTFDVSFLKIHRVEVKSEDGLWRKLEPIDPKDLGKDSIQEFQKTDGFPKYYDVIGESMFLYPAPSYNQDDSIKVWFERRGSYFTTTDTTKSAGFVDIYHRYLSLGAAYDYALKNNVENRNILREEISLMENAIQNYYSSRQPDEHIRLTAIKRNYK